ncbi:MAG TPA: CHAT domain-containing tetratricopeptide repeat protein, partial [Candidatus Eisenbacteria bacterium]
REALAIQRKAYGSEHADVAWTLRRLGKLEAGRGRFTAARAELLNALRIQEKVLSPDHPDLGWTLSNLAFAEANAGDLDLAIAHGERARAIQERALGPRHPDLAPTLAGLAHFNAMRGDTAAALELALRSSRIRAEQLALTSGGLSERQAIAYAAAGPTGLDEALSLIAYPGALGTPASARQVWDAVLQTRTLVLDDAAARHRATLEDSTSGEAAIAGLALRGARQRLANLLVRGPGGESPERYQAVLRRARLDMERAERDVGARSTGARNDGNRTRPGLGDVLSALPPGWGIVAYASYISNGKRSYIAFVRGAAGEPAAVRIGDAKGVDALVRRWAADVLSNPADAGAAANKAESASRASGDALRAKIWDPLSRMLGDATGVLIIPDGTLHGVNFGALPAAGRSYLVESGPVFHYISSELDIVTKQAAVRHGSGLLAIGGVDFGAVREPGTRARTGREGAAATGGDCTGFYDSQFLPLPQARLEVEEIARGWSDSTPALVVTGSDASEAAFKRLAPGKRVLHLATHGFFLDPNGCAREGAGVRGIAGLETAVRPRPRPAFQQQSLLLLSGLALARANRRSEVTPHEEDGVLTAEEVASLDLRGVEWAVLSACDTGLAGTSRGEEILGLRRAFQTAGVATLVISLWPVQDQAAREWMRALYQARFHAGVGTAQAVRDAMLEVLRSRRAQGRSTNPSFWAAFLAAGDWN